MHSFMDRRKFLGTAGGTALAVSLAGCTEAFGQTDAADGHGADGGLIAEVVSSAPEDATVVNATTGRVGSVDAIQDVLERAVESDQDSALRPIENDEAHADIEGALESIPYYTGESTRGYYLGYENSIILLYQYYRTDGGE